MKLQDTTQRDVDLEAAEGKTKEGKQDTVDTPLTSPSDDVQHVEVFHIFANFPNFIIKFDRGSSLNTKIVSNFLFRLFHYLSLRIKFYI